jgi:hypothetical protein
VTFEARLAFILFFFFVWCVLGLIPWAIAAVIVRGRGALLALPLALAAACVLGVLVPLAGLKDGTGFLLSLAAALLGATAGAWGGILLSRRLGAAPANEDGGRTAGPTQ